ncbi:hypothetical protein BBJ28_00005976 [Nothophytophthora sp. Chile5]|nr:hypothetical protein BBJ28_00005976 [Nothophytophthora sp. Chile5]
MARLGVFATVAALLLLPTAVVVAAGSCTVFETHTTIQRLAAAVASNDCTDYSTGSSLSVPCDAGACITVVDTLLGNLPNCTLDASENGGKSSNKKTELQKALDECEADPSSSVTVDTAVASSPASSTVTSAPAASGDECTVSEARATTQLYMEAASSTACEQYAVTDSTGTTVSIYAPCSATQCLAVVEAMIAQLPDCYYDGVNVKDELQQSLNVCTGEGSSSAVSDPVSTSSPTSSTSANECSSTEVSTLAYLTNLIVTSTECEPYVTATTTEWYIAVPCTATTCLATLESTTARMPNCEFDGTNYKQELQAEATSCQTVEGGGSQSSTGSSASLRSEAPVASTNSSSSADTSSAHTEGFHGGSVAIFMSIQAVLVVLIIV